MIYVITQVLESFFS